MKRLFRPTVIILGGVWILGSCASQSESEFDRADLNDDDRITTEEIEDRLVEAIFEKEDQNRDGKVTPAEWFLVNPNSSIVHFDARDTNKDQAVALEEFQKYADSSKMFDEVLAKLDPNEDGFVSSSEAEKVLATASQ